MPVEAHNAFLENRVLGADALELVRLLYQGAVHSVREARAHLAAGRILERSRAISKTCGIVMELRGSLDHERGGEISSRLAALYEYMERRLLEANFQQSDLPLAEVLALLTTLSEAWDGISKPAETAASPQDPWSVPQDSSSTYSPQVWSL